MIIYTRHAIYKRDALGLDKAAVRRVIRQGMKWINHGGKWHANMEGLEVVFLKKGGSITVITLYLAWKK
ncbi:MAG: hypothetical protein QF486_03190 [Candidatus Woesearchaeota archaeon]|jgi:hypothetical protein|nr:hypothetical protein [Candidatus Woesearchaeota archaeon]MDP7181559.1 hypothetical protein [Candidatus Woesearchaeota archaeon]MDP7198601.1 hypothetical protein [Candidatus Woesearchaeota archaeon]MDP7466657.1 hypothetical protein [Candidatus Woesearchaeota archaeon]MDP7646913.1 hypothetical protein [Candidatus Woesearchaeota archaeon]|tara:strand:- start:42 stop:248 length:207 start_codon:yes stop_codon:yes gene_type:complete